jgi:type III secretion protein Q
VRLLLDLRGLEALTRAYERAPVQRDPMPELVLPLCAVAGRTRLSMAELDRARAGDLLVLEEAPVARGRLDLMAGDMLAFACRLEGTSLVYAGEVTSRVAGESGAIAERLDEAPVELVFELGRLSVPLGELRSLAAGHVFDLGRDLRHPVDILLGGRKVGEGELVQVGERVGVRLRSLVPR